MWGGMYVCVQVHALACAKTSAGQPVMRAGPCQGVVHGGSARAGKHSMLHLASCACSI